MNKEIERGREKEYYARNIMFAIKYILIVRSHVKLV